MSGRTGTTDRREARLRRVSFLLFGLLSVATLVGPALIFWVGRGGQRETYPPDRPIEWQVFLSVIILYILLFTVTIYVSTLLLRAQRRQER